MTSQSDGSLALINQLLAEKDRLIAEKDELVASKDKLWREMYHVVQERDAKIERLEDEVRATRDDCACTETRRTEKQNEALRAANEKLVERNRALEEALRGLLDPEQDDEEGDDEMVPLAAVKSEQQDDKRWSSKVPASDDAGFGRQFEASPARLQASMPSPDSENLSNKPAALPTFSFAPLITMSEDGLYEMGSIGGVAPVVLRSIRSQLATLETRVKEGKSPAMPSAQFHSSGCF
ncbi:hypothetical protein LTR85_000405 [Meristemomyces frigidus]|nr:hypothetical protein LTR85_000405 [Meristemomyces frigidus]